MFIQNQVNPLISDNLCLTIIEFYQQMKNSLKNRYSLVKIRHLEMILQLGKCRAKIDLRRTVWIEDILDAIEIISDTKMFPKKNWEYLAWEKNHKSFHDIYKIRKFSKKIRQHVSIKEQTVFDIQALEKHLGQTSAKSGTIGLCDVLTRSSLLEKKNEKFFRLKERFLNIY